jgi:hypothetical protein
MVTAGGAMKILMPALWFCLAAPAAAGPWLREAGEGFLSFSVEAVGSGNQAGSAFATVYAEYGLSERITLGFDLGGSEDDLYKTVIFAKSPIPWLDADLKGAMELGIGMTRDQMILRPGISLGRGFPLGTASGWMVIDTLAHIEAQGSGIHLTTDVTFGVNMTDRSKFILQLQSGHDLMDLEHLKIAPSYVFERKPGQHVELGMLAGLENSEDFAIKLGLWRGF